MPRPLSAPKNVVPCSRNATESLDRVLMLVNPMLDVEQSSEVLAPIH
jgi:hypothetical protein